MIGRREFVAGGLAGLGLALSACSPEPTRDDPGSEGGEGDGGGETARGHVTAEDVAGVFYYETSGLYIARVVEGDEAEVVSALATLDAATAEDPSPRPEVSVGVWDTGEVAYAVYDGTLYETDLAAADAVWNLWLRLAGLADGQGS